VLAVFTDTVAATAAAPELALEVAWVSADNAVAPDRPPAPALTAVLVSIAKTAKVSGAAHVTGG
jgi:hypothetical protein